MTEKDDSYRDDSMDCVNVSLDTFSAMTVADEIIKSGSFDPLSDASQRQHHDIAIALMNRKTDDGVADEAMIAKVIENLDLFTGADRKIIKEKLIREGRTELLVNHVEKFAGCLTEADAFWFIDRGLVQMVVRHLDGFVIGDYRALAVKLHAVGRKDLAEQVRRRIKGVN